MLMQEIWGKGWRTSDIRRLTFGFRQLRPVNYTRIKQ